MSDDVKRVALNMRSQGKSTSAISRDMNIKRRVLRKFFKRFDKRKMIDNKRSSGRPRKTTEAADRLIRRISVASPMTSSTEIAKVRDSRIGQRLSGYRTPSSAWFRSFWTTCGQEAAHLIEESQGATGIRTGAYRMDDGAMETGSLVGRVQVPDVLFR